MANYVLKQISNCFMEKWNNHFKSNVTSKEEIVEILSKMDVSESITFNTNENKGKLISFDKNINKEYQKIEMSPSAIFEGGLIQLYDSKYNILNHKITKALITIPVLMDHLLLKHVFALINLGVDVYIINSQNNDLKDTQIIQEIYTNQIELIICTPQEASNFARISKQKNICLDCVLGLLLTEQIYSSLELLFLSNQYLNAKIHVAYNIPSLDTVLFSCEQGNIHLNENPSTLIELKPIPQSDYFELLFTIVKDELKVFRYRTGDICKIIKTCQCSDTNFSIKVFNSNRDDIYINDFISEVSEFLYSENYENEIIIKRIGNTLLAIIITEQFIKKNILNYFSQRYPAIKILNKLYKQNLDNIEKNMFQVLEK